MSEVEIEQKDYFTLFGQKISNNGETVSSLIIIPLYLFLIVYFVIKSFVFNPSISSFSRKGEIIDKIQLRMNDPDSFKLREFKKSYSTSCNDTYLVRFSGKNSFGGTVTNTYFVIYKNGEYCFMGDYGTGGSDMGISENEMMEMLINGNECGC